MTARPGSVRGREGEGGRQQPRRGRMRRACAEQWGGAEVGAQDRPPRGPRRCGPKPREVLEERRGGGGGGGLAGPPPPPMVPPTPAPKAVEKI